MSEHARVLICVWVNDEQVKRAYGRANDAYQVFKKMLDNGYPPSDWSRLLSQAEPTSKRQLPSFERLLKLIEE